MSRIKFKPWIAPWDTLRAAPPVGLDEGEFGIVQETGALVRRPTGDASQALVFVGATRLTRVAAQANHTITLDDSDKMIVHTGGGNNTQRLPELADATAFQPSWNTQLSNRATGTMDVRVTGSNSSINGVPGPTIAVVPPGAAAQLIYVSPGVWELTISQSGLDTDGLNNFLNALKGASNGLASLDVDGKLQISQFPEALVGAMRYKGAWNASTNNPAMPSSATANRGFYYIVAVAGTTTVDGVNDWAVGDWIVSSGTAWQKIDNTDSVTSVAGLKGAIAANALKTALALQISDISGLQVAIDNAAAGSGGSSVSMADINALKGAANGLASLDGSAKIPIAQIPAAVIGAMNYQGAWNASTNSPAMPAAAAGNKGYYYKVSVAGSTSINGINDWGIGDWIVSNGAAWDKIDNTDAIASVAGLTGVISAAGLKTALALTLADLASGFARGAMLTDKLAVVNANTSATSLDLTTAGVFIVNVQASTSITFDSMPTLTAELFNFTVITVNDSTAGRAVAFPAASYAGGAAPPRTTAASAVDVWNFFRYPGGPWIGSLSVKDAK